AIASDAHAGGILDGLARARDVLAEFAAVHAVHALVIPAVAGDLMPSGGDLAQQGAVPLGDPAEREEGGDRFSLVEQVEDRVDVALDPVREPSPVVPLDHALK